MSDKQNVLTKEEQEQMEELIKKGERIIFPERAEQWENYVEDCFKGQYKGQDAAEALTIIEALNNGVEIEDAKKMLKEIEPNGEANGLVRRAVLLFANNGPEFWKDTSKGHISLRTRWQLFKISRENARLIKMYQYTLAAGNDSERDDSEINKKSNEGPSKSWVLGDDEMQIVIEQQGELTKKAEQASKQTATQIKAQEPVKDDEYNKGLER